MLPGFLMRRVAPSGWVPIRQVPPEGWEIHGKRVAAFWREMYQVSVEETFSAGHALRGYRGKCENVHGHNYRVRVTLEGPQLDAIGLLVDFTQLKQVIREIMGRLDHQFMNDLEPFKDVKPLGGNGGEVFLQGGTPQNNRLPPGARVTD